MLHLRFSVLAFRRFSGILGPMKRPIVYRRATLAIVLPVSLLVITWTPFLDVLLTMVLRRRNTPWLFAAAFVMLVAIECRYLATLLRLIRVRGQVNAFLALEADPIQSWLTP